MPARPDKTYTGWVISLWTLLVLGGFFFFAAPRLPGNVPFVPVAVLVVVVWAAGAAGITMRIGKAWLVAGREAGFEPAEKDRSGIRSYLLPRMQAHRQGRELTLDTNRPMRYGNSFTWTHVTARYRDRDVLGSVRAVRSGAGQRGKRKTANAEKRSPEEVEAAMQEVRAALKEKQEASKNPEDRRRQEEILERVEREAGLMSMQSEEVTTGDDRFDRRFKITAQRGGPARGLFNEPVRSRLQAVDQLDRLTVGDGVVEITVRGRAQSPSLVEAMVEAALQLAQQAEQVERRPPAHGGPSHTVPGQATA